MRLTLCCSAYCPVLHCTLNILRHLSSATIRTIMSLSSTVLYPSSGTRSVLFYSKNRLYCRGRRTLCAALHSTVPKVPRSALCCALLCRTHRRKECKCLKKVTNNSSIAVLCRTVLCYYRNVILYSTLHVQ